MINIVKMAAGVVAANNGAEATANTAITLKEFLYKGWLGIICEQGRAPGWLYIAAIVICVVLGYFLGSINFAVVISKIKYKDDIRKHGSGNAGATNMSRIYGKSAGIATFAGDLLKTVATVVIARFFCGEVIAYLAGFFCALGHAFPCYYRFKGGKCVAVTAAMALTLDPVVFFLVFLIFATVLWATKYVSLSSICAALIYPIILYNVLNMRMGGSDLRVVFVMALCILIVVLHKDNIKRLIEGKENKFSFKKSKK